MVLNIANQPPAAHPPGVKRARIWRRRLREPLLTFLLVIQIFLLFVMPPIHAAGFQVPHIAVWSIFLVFVSLATILSRSNVAMLTMLISVALTIAGAIWKYEETTVLTDVISILGQILTQVCLLWIVSTAVFGSGRTTHHRILGAVVMYLCIGMIFTSFDILLIQFIPNAFSHISTNTLDLRDNMIYFSFSTLTTGSFGDIIPLHPIAHSLANLESICGQLFPATLLARIVTLHSLWHDK
jgi:hypothetical protein